MYKHATSAADGNYDNDVIEVDTENDDDVLNNDEDGDSVRVDEKEDDTNMDGYYDQDDETDRTLTAARHVPRKSNVKCVI